MRTISLTAIENIPMIKAGDDLAALISRGLDAIRADGTWAEINKRWIGQ